MKKLLRKLFSPVLNRFESGTEPYAYKPSHRLILVVMGSLFTGLACAILWFAIGNDPAYFLPVLVFGVAGLLSLIIGLLGNDRAVATIWGSR